MKSMTLNELFITCTQLKAEDGPYELQYETWVMLYHAIEKRRNEEEMPFLSAQIDRPNFLCGGIPVVPQIIPSS